MTAAPLFAAATPSSSLFLRRLQEVLHVTIPHAHEAPCYMIALRKLPALGY
jgi:hypothetical protein